MKTSITIYSNFQKTYILENILKNYNLSFEKLSTNKIKKKSNELSIVFYDKNYDEDIFLENISDNTIIISNNINLKDKYSHTKFLISPTTLNQLKRSINYIISQKNISLLDDIKIINEKIINMKNKKSCQLTLIEKEILTVLISKKNCDKSFIKENILNLKKNIETNSLESHLTRIRKKLELVGSKIKLISKKDTVSYIID